MTEGLGIKSLVRRCGSVYVTLLGTFVIVMLETRWCLDRRDSSLAGKSSRDGGSLVEHAGYQTRLIISKSLANDWPRSPGKRTSPPVGQLRETVEDLSKSKTREFLLGSSYSPGRALLTRWSQTQSWYSDSQSPSCPQ